MEEGTTDEISVGPSLNVRFKRLCRKWALGDLTVTGAFCALKLFHEEFKMEGCQLILGIHNDSQVNHRGKKKKAKFQVRVIRVRGREPISSKKMRTGENIRPPNERKN